MRYLFIVKEIHCGSKSEKVNVLFYNKGFRTEKIYIKTFRSEIENLDLLTTK